MDLLEYPEIRSCVDEWLKQDKKNSSCPFCGLSYESIKFILIDYFDYDFNDINECYFCGDILEYHDYFKCCPCHFFDSCDEVSEIIKEKLTEIDNKE